MGSFSEIVKYFSACYRPVTDLCRSGSVAPVDTAARAGLADFDLAGELERVVAVFERFMPWYRKQYATRECSIPKAVALNLKWNNTCSTRHPREALYDAIVDLLRDRASLSHERFYELQRRFA